jgi:hypothetical protein
MLIGTGFVTPDVAEWVREAAIVLVLALAVVAMLAIAITAVSTPLVIVHETMALFSITVNGAGDAVRPFCAASAHVIAVSGCCRRPLGIVLKVKAIRYSNSHGAANPSMTSP